MRYGERRGILQQDTTFEAILERLIDGAREQFPELDTREGSLIYSALAPAALEMSRLYASLQFALEMSYADTASREFLIRRAAERGIQPFAATSAVIEAVFEPPEVQVPDGTRFRAGAVVFVVDGQNAEGRPSLTAESAGVVGNMSGGRLVPIDFVEGLGSAHIRALTVPGQDEEGTEALRQRYMESHRAQSFGGNVAAYREKVRALPGVGGVRVFPAHMGPGTVGVSILAANSAPASATLLASVQDVLDPSEMTGEGRGWAPIGHRVTVVSAEAYPIAVSVSLTLRPGEDTAVVQDRAEEVIEAYFLELRAVWDNGEAIIVRISQIETRLLDAVGVLDVADTTLNGQRGNLILEETQVPVFGGLTRR